MDGWRNFLGTLAALCAIAAVSDMFYLIPVLDRILPFLGIAGIIILGILEMLREREKTEHGQPMPFEFWDRLEEQWRKEKEKERR